MRRQTLVTLAETCGDEAELRSRLRFDAPVARGLAHRAAVSEVLPTDTLRVTDDRFLVAAQTPRSHLLFNDGPNRFHDMLVLVEAVRQGGTVVAHTFLDVPMDIVFVLQRAEVEVVNLDALRAGPAPAQLVVDLQLSDFVRRNGVITTMTGRTTVSIDGAVAAKGGGTMIGVPLRAYHTVRPPALKRSPAAGATTASPAEVPAALPHRVGRGNPRNVVIDEPRPPASDGSRSCRLLVDPRHPHFFDHPQDHVPGTLMLEACRQLGVAVVADLTGADAADLQPTLLRTAFRRYAELSRPVEVTAVSGEPRLPERGGVTVGLDLSLTQGDATVATASLTLVEAEDTSWP